MENTTNNRLKMVYNGNETIMNAGFSMRSNYILPVLTRMNKEGLITLGGQTVIQTILQYKHTEDNPFPSREEIARLLGMSVPYVKKALASIKEIGILPIVKKTGRNNTYNFKPFFELVEKFIVEYKEKKNYNVKVSELLNVNIQKKEKSNFDWSEKYTGETEVVQTEAPEEAPEEEVAEVLPEEIKKVCGTYEVSSEGIKAVEKSYISFSGKLKDEVFTEKIIVSASKDEFVKYYNTCITKAHVDNEQPKQQPVQKEKPKQNGYQNKKVVVEPVPEWLEKETEGKQEKVPSMTEYIASASTEELEELKENYEQRAKVTTNNKSVQLNEIHVNARLNDMSLTVEQLKKIEL